MANSPTDMLIITVKYVLAAAGILAPIIALALIVGAVVGLVGVGAWWKSQDTDKPSTREIMGLSLIFSLLGMTFGYLSGNSRTPVIGDVLPSIITFITALTGYLISRQKTSALWKKCMPVGLAAMLVATLSGVAIGSQMRRDAEFHDEVRQVEFEQYRKFAIEYCFEAAKTRMADFMATAAEADKELAALGEDGDNAENEGPNINKLLCGFRAQDVGKPAPKKAKDAPPSEIKKEAAQAN